MQIIQFQENLTQSTPMMVTIGNFDGVHLGHQALIRPVVAEARQRQCASALVTFDPHPMEVVRADHRICRICNQEQNLELLKKTGLDIVHIIHFTQAFSQLSPEDFARRFLIEQFNLVKLFIGHDFHFGKKRAGNAELLKQMSVSHGFEVEEVPQFQINGQTVSSSFIRELIQQCRFDDIAPYLGRRYSLRGQVVKGDQRGRTLGVPTANLCPSIMLPLPYGVYVTEVAVAEKQHYGVTNVGVRPTFGEHDPTVETWIFDVDEDLYGKTLEVWPLKQLRVEKKFASQDALKQQISQDIAAARAFLEQRK